ncbi:MAG: HigA family addiction module antidote protein [Magnetococcales bacterium]|nr:HigA family addiction module antidote protein [Magnetococcales bacterium]
MRMKSPVHPGAVILYDCIEPLGMTVTEAATALQVTEETLEDLIQGKSGVTADIAIRIEQVFGGTAKGWLVHQINYDLAHINRSEIKLSKANRNNAIEATVSHSERV